jgi:hypothetical protein
MAREFKLNVKHESVSPRKLDRTAPARVRRSENIFLCASSSVESCPGSTSHREAPEAQVAEQIAERSFDPMALLDHASSQLTDHNCCLGLDGLGLKVCDFHPNTIYLNASWRALRARLLLESLDHVVVTRMSVARLD